MLKILSAKQIKELDQFTIEHEPIAPIDLMERACRVFVDWYVLHFRADKKIAIVCGPGNNGGDGLGIGRLLRELGYPVAIWMVKGGQQESASFRINRQRIDGKINVREIEKESNRDLFSDYQVIIDALFGSGLTRPTEGIYAQVISSINHSEATRVAVDIPSGLFADSPSRGEIVEAHHTVSFQLPKLAFLFPENHPWVGQWHCVDIGLSRENIKSAPATNFFVNEKAIKKIIRTRGQFSHKGDFGHALLIAGSLGKMGACVLAAKAALRSGLGLLTVHSPACGYTVIQTAVPEAMAYVDVSANHFSSAWEDLNYAAIGIGPGLGTHTETVKGFTQVLSRFRKPMVIDADGLNILSAHQEFLQLIPEGSILTPHPKEFERMAGHWSTDFERLELLRNFSIKLKSIIVLKGAFTSIACPDGNVYFNSTGNPGMAKGGSGDVLTGILTALLAQEYSPKNAALMGVYLHGLAGDLAANEFGMDSMTATDLVNQIPYSFKKLHRG